MARWVSQMAMGLPLPDGHVAGRIGLAHEQRSSWPREAATHGPEPMTGAKNTENSLHHGQQLQTATDGLFWGEIMKVLVCDDHPIVASAIAMMIETAFGATVHIATDYRHAAAIVRDHPDIELCLLDIHIPGEDTTAGIRALKTVLPKARMMLFSGSAEEADLMLALNLDMHGFLPKSSSAQVVEAAVRLVMAGGIYLPRGIGEMAMRLATPAPLVREPGNPPTEAIPTAVSTEAGYGTLTDRQMVVLQKVSAGRSNKEIARELGISPATVKAYVAQIIAFLGASNRTEAAARARTLGLIS